MPAIRKKLFRGRAGPSTHRPLLRRSSTLTLPDVAGLLKRKTSKTLMTEKKSSIASLKPGTSNISASNKTSIVLEDEDISTAVVRLDSGSHTGMTSSLTTAKVTTHGLDLTAVDDFSMEPDETPVEAAVTALDKSPSSTSAPALTKAASLSNKTSLSKDTSSLKSDVYTAPPLPPGGLIEIAISFDTTWSMFRCIAEVKGKIQDIVQKLQADIPGIRIAIIAHGDYCDKASYIVKWIDFGADVNEISDFVENVGQTSGGDKDECYELVLRRVQTVLSWTPGSQRSLDLIGDAAPYEPGYKYGDFTNDINWRVEAKGLANMGVRIYSVGAKDAHIKIPFYKEIADITGGKVLRLGDFSIIFDMLMTICYHEGGSHLSDAYESEVRARHDSSGLDVALEALFARLKGKYAPTSLPPTSDTGTPITLRSRDKKSKSCVPEKEHNSRMKKSKVVIKPTITLHTKATKTREPKKKPMLNAKNFKPSQSLTKQSLVKKGSTLMIKKKPTKKSTNPSKSKMTKRVKRETLTDSKFIKGPLAKLDWTLWREGVSPKPLRKWRHRETYNKHSPVLNAYYNLRLFPNIGELNKPAIWEFGVQCPDAITKKVHPVYFSFCRGVKTHQSWCRYFLTWPSHVRTAVQNIVKNGGQIMVRKAEFRNNSDKFSATLLKYMNKFDYAWRGKSSHRVLKRQGFVVSS